MKQKIFMTGSTSYVGTKFQEMYGDEFDILGVARTDGAHPVDLLDPEAVKKSFINFSPDFVLHLAADVGRDATTSEEIIKTNPAITECLVELALRNNTPFLFTSTEAVYGGKEHEGGYVETDPYKPRSPYGASKVASEKIVMNSGLPYLITRGHRHVGVSKNFHKSKQFLDTLNPLLAGQTVHLDSQKKFNPVLINNVCDIFAHYITHDSDRQVLINMGADEVTTFYDFFADLAGALGVSSELVRPDGEEPGWTENGWLSVARLHELGYPYMGSQMMVEAIKNDLAA